MKCSSLCVFFQFQVWSWVWNLTAVSWRCAAPPMHQICIFSKSHCTSLPLFSSDTWMEGRYEMLMSIYSCEGSNIDISEVQSEMYRFEKHKETQNDKSAHAEVHDPLRCCACFVPSHWDRLGSVFFLFPSKSDLGTSGSRAFYQTRVFGVWTEA